VGVLVEDCYLPSGDFVPKYRSVEDQRHYNSFTAPQTARLNAATKFPPRQNSGRSQRYNALTDKPRLVLCDGVLKSFGDDRSGIEREGPSTLLSAPQAVHEDPENVRYRKSFTREVATPVKIGTEFKKVKHNIYEGQGDGQHLSNPSKGTYNYPMSKMRAADNSWSSQRLASQLPPATTPGPQCPTYGREHLFGGFTAPADTPIPPGIHTIDQYRTWVGNGKRAMTSRSSHRAASRATGPSSPGTGRPATGRRLLTPPMAVPPPLAARPTPPSSRPPTQGGDPKGGDLRARHSARGCRGIGTPPSRGGGTPGGVGATGTPGGVGATGTSWTLQGGIGSGLEFQTTGTEAFAGNGLVNQAIPKQWSNPANGVLVDGVLQTKFGNAPGTMLSAPANVQMKGTTRAKMFEGFGGDVGPSYGRPPTRTTTQYFNHCVAKTAFPDFQA